LQFLSGALPRVNGAPAAILIIGPGFDARDLADDSPRSFCRMMTEVNGVRGINRRGGVEAGK